MNRRVLAAFLVAAALLAPGCKKKPKATADGGSGGGGSAVANAAAAQSGEGVVVWPVVELRATPAEKSNLLSKLGQGAKVLVLERRDGWARVRPVDGKNEGWVIGQSVQGGVVVGGPAAKVAASPARIRVDKARVNLRDTANGEKIGKLARGTTMTIVRDEGQWLEVEGGGKKGWVARAVVTVIPAAPSAPAQAAAATAPAQRGAALGEGKVLFKKLNVRKGPEKPPFTQLARGDHVTILTEVKAKELFYEVRADDGRTGWVVARAIERIAARAPAPSVEPAPSVAAPAPSANVEGPKGGPGSTSIGRVKWTRVRMRESAPKGPELRMLPKGTTVEILAAEGKYYRVRAGTQEGVVVAKALELASAKPAPTGAPIPPPTPPTLTEQPRIAAPDERAEAERRGAASPGATHVVKWTNVNLREGPEKNEKMIDKLARGTKLREIGAEGNWVEVETLDGRRGWVSRNSLRVSR